MNFSIEKEEINKFDKNIKELGKLANVIINFE